MSETISVTQPVKKQIEYNSNEWWAFSILSDVQEMIDRNMLKEANEAINNAKRVLQGKYRFLDNGFTIEILKDPADWNRIEVVQNE